jgi:hypothetical protein
MLGDLAILKAIYAHTGHGDGFAAWGPAEERSAVGALCGHIRGNLIIFCNLFQYLDLDVGESGKERFEERFMVVPKHVEALVVCTWHGMIDAILRPEVFQRNEVLTMPYGLDEFLYGLFIALTFTHEPSPYKASLSPNSLAIWR